MTDTISISQATLDSLWDFSDPDASADRFRDAAEDSSYSDIDRAVLQTQLARALGLAGQADQAEALLERGPGRSPDELVQARVALERGRLRVAGDQDGEREDAVGLFTLAARKAASTGSPFLALDALHMLALTDTGHEEEWANEGLAMLDAVSASRVRRWGVALNINLAWYLHDSGRPADALVHFERALDTANAVGTAEQQFIGQWALGRCLRSLGRTAEALVIQERLAAVRPDDEFVQAELAELTVADRTIE
ncbi:tetratricopeptide repeat protein [Glaciibacter superstes]|uniref:tetratricopeptide repeat protein n=1 Tax=Glaciibacter superstes TaxID=501023 RepID=UPI0003B40FA6|nr:tetratricopeptide repeat protein [Glaciibacter superstes]